MEDDRRAAHAAGDPGRPELTPALQFDEMLGRLEDVLLAYPYDRALPNLGVILDQAGISQDFLRTDDRAIKVLHEAILARPLGTRDVVARVKTEVELLTLEVRVLTERLHRPEIAEIEVDRAAARLARVRRRLDEIRRQL
ncbi:MAG TPA: hypothetical protein VGA69_07150 [Nitriliruptorales bacterium]